MWLMVAVCAGLSVAGAGAGLAPFITPCTTSDQECMKSSAQKAVPILAAGIPALDVNPLDPMLVPKVKASQAGLDMDFRNTVVKGLRNCQVIGLKRNNRKMFFEVKCSITLVGDYVLGGKLLILPIEGNGKYKIKIRDIIVKIAFDVADKLRDDVKYWSIADWKHSSEVQTNVEFQFQNLFNGNKQLSDAIHQFANTNWREIFQEVAPPIVKAVVGQIVDETRKFFDHVPAKELTLDY